MAVGVGVSSGSCVKVAVLSGVCVKDSGVLLDTTVGVGGSGVLVGTVPYLTLM